MEHLHFRHKGLLNLFYYLFIFFYHVREPQLTTSGFVMMMGWSWAQPPHSTAPWEVFLCWSLTRETSSQSSQTNVLWICFVWICLFLVIFLAYLQFYSFDSPPPTCHEMLCLMKFGQIHIYFQIYTML